jgi:hypothetical protein
MCSIVIFEYVNEKTNKKIKLNYFLNEYYTTLFKNNPLKNTEIIYRETESHITITTFKYIIDISLNSYKECNFLSNCSENIKNILNKQEINNTLNKKNILDLEFLK